MHTTRFKVTHIAKGLQMHNSRDFFFKAMVAVALLTAGNLWAQGYENGNRLALDYSRADNAGRTRLREERARVAHSFRYLEIIEIEKDNPDAPRRIVLVTVEPSSDMEVQLIVTARNSLRLAQTLEVGEHIAADGRIADLGLKHENRMILQPSRVNSRDRATPKHGPELLREIDPTAH